MKSILSLTGTALTGVGSSACCWIPALLGTGAAGSLGIGAAIAPWRPYLLGLTAIFLATGFYFAYRTPKEASCADGACASDGGRLKRRVRIGVLWVVAIFAVGMAAYPYIGVAQLNTANAASQTMQQQSAALPTQQLVFDVEGMDCAGCAVTLQGNLEKVPGVTSAAVDFENATATVWHSGSAPDSDELMKAVRDAGFKADLAGIQKNPMTGMAMDGPTVPPVKGYAEGMEVRFIHTEASDPDIANLLTDMMNSPVLVVPSLAAVPAASLANVYVFVSGVEGGGPLGFQPDVFDGPPGTKAYSPLRVLNKVAWADKSSARVLKSAAEVKQSEAAGELTIERTDVVINMPLLTWPGGQR
ncbi:MAG: cation transporter [Armatimonadetes bacterium]|nr:cation transporter [Armatimonadota bacterium]